MIVTVQETIEHSADITAEMVVAYALRHGWQVESEDAGLVRLERTADPSYSMILWRDMQYMDDRIMWFADAEGRKPHEVLADIADGEMSDTMAHRRSDATPLTDTVDELLALRKQAALDRQSREASQTEFSRLNRELNEAKARIESLTERIELWKVDQR